MFTKKLIPIVLVASALLLAMGAGPGVAYSARALPAAQGPAEKHCGARRKQE
jgi:hypothetical protein